LVLCDFLNCLVLKKILLSCILSITLSATFSQGFTANNLLEAVSVSKQKISSYIAHHNFSYIGASYMGDTIAHDYFFKKLHKKNKNADSIFVKRTATYYTTKEDFCVTYRTTSAEEFAKIMADVKKQGFFCNEKNTEPGSKPLLYQHNDLTVAVSAKTIDTLTEYSLLARKQPLPKPKEIEFAEDLGVFTSHEYLRYYFGEANVKTDVYYLSETEVAKCSILFPNTSRQVVFLWEDEVNNAKLYRIYVGGQLASETSRYFDHTIAENVWETESGVRPGMSLYNLRMMNDAAFNFHGGKSTNTGLIIADGNTGKIDFKKETIILGCLNCTDNQFARQSVVNSDEALADERILFVLTVIIDPNKKEVTTQPTARK
jgi:hypothetical protein